MTRVLLFLPVVLVLFCGSVDGRTPRSTKTVLARIDHGIYEVMEGLTSMRYAPAAYATAMYHREHREWPGRFEDIEPYLGESRKEMDLYYEIQSASFRLEQSACLVRVDIYMRTTRGHDEPVLEKGFIEAKVELLEDEKSISAEAIDHPDASEEHYKIYLEVGNLETGDSWNDTFKLNPRTGTFESMKEVYL